MDDLDDILDDLLADAPPKKSSTPGSAGSGRRGTPAKAGKVSNATDEDFYKMIADNVGQDQESDVSEADMTEMNRGLDDIDDMDAALFGGRKSTTPNSSRKPGTPGTGVGAKKPVTKSPAKSTFDDDDDPLAGLLSDDESMGDKKSPKLKSALKSSSRPTTADKDEELNSQGNSRRLEIDRPPTRSGSGRSGEGGDKKPPRGRKRNEDIGFDDDDDDVLGGMGLDSPTREKESKPTSAQSGKSIMDDLFGGGGVNKHLQRPGTGDNKPKEFVLGDKYTKGKQAPKQEKEATDEDFTFGGYMPTAATGSRPSSKRSVRFEGDDDIFGTRPASAPGPRGARRGGPASLLEDMIEKDDTDWLSMASGKEEENNRPRSEGGKPANRQSGTKPSVSTDAPAEPVDWLGLARLGSPESPRPPPLKGKAATAKKEDSDDDVPFPKHVTKKKQPEEDLDLGTSAKPKPKSTTQGDADDWLGLGSKKTNTQSQRRLGSAEPTEKSNDWLGLKDDKPTKDSGSDDWLGLKKDEPKKSGGGDDWLGIKKDEGKKSNDGDDWLGLKGSSKKQDSGDFLGLGKEIDPDSMFSKSTTPSKGVDELFAPPPQRDTSSSLPWESGRRRRESSVGSRGRSPESKGSQLVDSPRGLSDTLDFLQKMEQPKKTQQTAPVLQDSKSPEKIGKSDEHSVPIATPTSRQQDVDLQQQQQLQEQYEQQLKQQQQQQTDLQMKMIEQQEQMKKQQQEKMIAMQQAQQTMMEQQMAAMQSQMSVPSFGMPGMLSMGGEDFESKARKLEIEKKHLEGLLEMTKLQHKEEIKLVEDSFKRRIDLLDETYNKRERRLKEENDLLSSQTQTRIKMVEEERIEMIASNQRRLESLHKEKMDDTDRLREIHRKEIEELRREHGESLQRVKKAKDEEVDALANSTKHAQSMQSVITQISGNARNLEDLQQKIETSHAVTIDGREQAANTRDENIRAMQERLERQQRDNEMERSRLQGLVSTLESQLKEQAEKNEEQSWRQRQEDTRLQALQKSVEREKELMLQQVQRERESVEKTKEQVLDEQKRVLAQLYEERRALADERSQFVLQSKLKAEEEQRSTVKSVQGEANVDGMIKAIDREKEKLSELAAKVKKDELEMIPQKTQIAQEKESIHAEKKNLESLALDLRQRSKEIEEMCMEGMKAKEEGTAALESARKLEAEQQQRFQQIQAHIHILREKEKQIAQERLGLAKERANMDRTKGSILCVNCSTPVKETFPTPGNVPRSVPVLNNGLPYNNNMTPAAKNLFQVLKTTETPEENLRNVSMQIEVDKSVRMWKIAADKDKEFLQEENFFLEALKYSPYGQPSAEN